MKTRSLYLLTALIGAVAFTVPWLARLAAQNSPVGMYSMSEWAHYQLNVNRTLETGTVGKVVGYTGSGTIGVLTDAGGLPEAPLGTSLYARSNALWQVFPPGLATMQVDDPNDGGVYGRWRNGWQQIQSTVTGGTLDIQVANLAEHKGDGIAGTLTPANTRSNLNLTQIYDPSGLLVSVDPITFEFVPEAGTYAVTAAVPMAIAGTGSGIQRIPYNIELWQMKPVTNRIYYSSFTIFDDQNAVYSSVFLPVLEADGISSFALRVANLHASIPIQAGLDNATVNEVNHYGEIQLLKLNGAVTLPASEWAVRELLMNTALEVGTVGQAIGYTAAGEVGVVSLGSGGGGGADPNAVASVPDLVTLSNLTGYVTAIVGGTNAAQSLWQYGPIAALFDGADWNNLYGSSSQTLTLESDGSTTARSSTIGYLGADWASPFDGKRVTLYYPAVASSASQLNYTASFNQVDPIEYTDFILTTTKKTFHRSFTAVDDTSFYCIATGTATDAFNFGPVWYAEGDWPVMPIPNGINIVGSPLNGFGWKKVGDIYPDALADGQTYGRKDGAWAVVSGASTSLDVTVTGATYQFPPTVDNITVTYISDGMTGNLTLTGEPTILPGVVGQYLTISNAQSRALIFTRSNPTAIYSPNATFTLFQNNVGYFRFRNDVGYDLWDAYGLMPVTSQSEVSLLPAPWEMPDADGNQVIRDDVQDALIDALLPRLLQRLGPTAGTLPTPAPAPRRLGKPGTRANPIDWPAAAPAGDTEGKYNINIQIGDR